MSQETHADLHFQNDVYSKVGQDHISQMKISGIIMIACKL